MAELYAGSSGWSYPTWRPDFYPAGTPNEDFLRSYAERLPSVELNTTGYRLPSEEQFERWAAQTPAGFRFSVKLPQRALRSIATFEERVRRLGERLGPVRVAVEAPRDDGLLELLVGSTDLRLAFDLHGDLNPESLRGLQSLRQGRQQLHAELGVADTEVERPQLGQRHVYHGAAAVGDPIDRRVVQDDNLAVAGQAHVTLEGVCLQFRRLLEGCDRVLGSMGGCTAMPDHDHSPATHYRLLDHRCLLPRHPQQGYPPFSSRRRLHANRSATIETAGTGDRPRR